MNLYSEHVFLRPLKLEDASSLLQLRIRNTAYLQPFEPVMPEDFLTLKGQETYIRKSLLDWEKDRGYGFGIFLLNQSDVIGCIRLSNVVRGAWQNCTVGYFIDEKMQGRGYMTESVSLGLRFVFEELGLHRVEAGVMCKNKKSMRVLEKVGFRSIGLSRKHIKINGIWEDHKLFSVVKEDWTMND